MASIGQRIKALRKAKNVTLQELATVINTNKGNISSYENDKYEPSAKTIVAICEYFGISTDWLLLGDEQQLSSELDSLTESEEKLLEIFRELTPYSKEEVLTYLQVRWKMDFNKGNSYLTSRSGEGGFGPSDDGNVTA